MGRKSTIQKAPPPLRDRIDKFVRDNRMTIAELRAALVADFGPDAVPSKSALHRYQMQQRELVERMAEQENVARVVVASLGEKPDEKAGALLAHTITTLMNHVLLNAHAAAKDKELSVKEIAQLARAARNAIEVRKLSLEERQEIARIAKETLLAEQKEQLAKVEKSRGLAPDVADMIRREILGIA